MGGQHVVQSTVLLLLLSVISTNNSDNINIHENLSQVLDTSDGSGGGSEHVTSVAGVTDARTEANQIEQSTPEISVVQKPFSNTDNETVSSVENLATVFSATNLQGSSESNNAENTRTTSPPINSADMIIEGKGKSEFLQQTNKENFSSFPEFDHRPNLNNSHTEDDNASFLNSNPSYSVATDYVTPQQYVGDLYVDSDNGSIITHNNYKSLNTENNSEEPFDENSFNQLINDGSDIYQDQMADQSDFDAEENQDANLENYNKSKIQSQSINDSVYDVLLDSPTPEFLNNSFDNEDIFEKVFNISDIVDSEENRYFNYQAGSVGHARESPGSNVQVSGSNTEQNLTDNENVMYNNVFEVYHYSRKPNPDGTMQNKTLGQHIEELVLNRLPSSNKDKDSDQIESGDHEESNISLDVEISPDEISESDEEGTHRGASLAFVFDSTGSMWDDLVQVKMGAERIMATMLELPDKPIYNYVLVPFHDPRIGPVTVTRDHNEFRESLQNITVHGGGDCPEMAVGAVKEALSVSLPNSFIYVFTDARAKDYNLIPDVLALIQRKKSQVVFVMTGDCGDNKHVGYQVFEKIASTSSGQVYHLNKTDVNEVLQFLQLSLQSRKVNLLSVNKPGPSVDEHNLFVDESLQEFTVSVSGLNPHIGVVSPEGKPVQGPPKLNTVLSLQNIKAVNVIEPEPGQWKVKVGSDSEHSVRSTGLSDVNFNFGFSVVVTDKMEETYHRPLKGDKNSVLVAPTQPDVVHNLTSLKLIDLKGNEFQEIPLHPVPDKPGLYQGSKFLLPNDFFHLGVDGFDKDGFPLKRISPTAITGQSPEPPVVHMKPEVRGWLKRPVRMQCHIESLIPFSAMWFKNGVPLTSRENYKQTAKLFWVLENPTVADEGNYSCHANNVAGRASSGTWLTITGPPPHVETPAQVVSALNKAAALDCIVESQLHYNVTWSKALVETITAPETENVQQLQNDEKTSILPNGTLIVNTVNHDDEGWYTCTATNKGGTSEGQVYLALKEPVHVEVVPERFHFQQGDSVSLSCHSTSIPKPSFVWKKDGHVLKEGDGRNLRLTEEESGLTLFLEYADPSYAGEYQCVAENDYEVDTGVSVGKYIEAPAMVAVEGSVLARVGDTVQLKCSAKGYPTPVIGWSRNEEEIVTSSKYEVQEDGTLLISDTQVTDNGEYICIAENELGVDIDVISLQVGLPPQIVHLPRDVQIDISGNGTVPCMAVGVPIPTVLWTREDGKQLNTSSTVTTEHGNLQIT
ncbi:hypothetical protein B7P43_G11501, partial [Cryptotermes secundus]